MYTNKAAQALRTFAQTMVEAQMTLLNELGANNYSDAMENLAYEVARDSGMHPKRDMGRTDSVKELHPNLLQDKVKGKLDIEVISLLTPAEKLAFAAYGSYENSCSSVPENLVQLFGNRLRIPQSPVSEYAATMINIADAIERQVAPDDMV